MRAHVIIPDDIAAFIDKRVGTRGRSKFLADLATKEVARIRRVEAAKKVAGSLAHVDIPGWETSESAVAWVRALRKSDDDNLLKLLHEKK